MEVGAGRGEAGVEELGAIPAWEESRDPHAATQLCPTPADARHPDQLPVPLAGALVDPDDAGLPGTGAGSDREPGVGAVTKPADFEGLGHTADVQFESS